MSNVTSINRRMNRQAFLKQRENARTLGFEFVLPDATLTNEGDPFVIRLRRISLQEKAAINGITQDVQDEVYRRTRDLAKWQAEQQRKQKDLAAQLDAIRDNDALIRAVNAVFCAVVIDPPVVETEAELTSTPDAWHVDDFTVDDRFAVFQAATDGDSKEAKSLKLFRPESDRDVPDSGALQDAALAKRDSWAPEAGD
jgi:hypothetical protein